MSIIIYLDKEYLNKKCYNLFKLRELWMKSIDLSDFPPTHESKLMCIHHRKCLISSMIFLFQVIRNKLKTNIIRYYLLPSYANLETL